MRQRHELGNEDAYLMANQLMPRKDEEEEEESGDGEK